MTKHLIHAARQVLLEGVDAVEEVHVECDNLLTSRDIALALKASGHSLNLSSRS